MNDPKTILYYDLKYQQEGKCFVCLTPEWQTRKSLQLHRIVKGKDGGLYEPDNVVLVCNKCHWRIEGIDRSEILVIRKYFNNGDPS